MPADAFKFTNWTTNLPTALSDALNGEFTDGVIVLTSAGIQINSTTQAWPAFGGPFSPPTVTLFSSSNSIAADISLNAVSVYVDGPVVVQGSVGTWLATATLTYTDTSGAENWFFKLWDGTNIIDSAASSNQAAGAMASVSLSGVITSPAGNIRASARDGTGTTGLLKANQSGNSKDCTVTVVRIA